MPVQVNVVTGSVTGGSLGPNVPFQWVNPTSNPVALSDCGTWCTASSYNVPAAANGAPGLAGAQVKPVPNANAYAFTDPAWNTPGQPHISVNPEPGNVVDDLDDTQEVA
jgi:hypothetical protein